MPLAPEPIGDDEPQVRAAYEREVPDGEPWDQLPDWKREAWRREVRDA